MEFKHIKDALARNFEQISANNTLFETDIDKDVLWNLYLDMTWTVNFIFERRTNGKLYYLRNQGRC